MLLAGVVVPGLGKSGSIGTPAKRHPTIAEPEYRTDAHHLSDSASSPRREYRCPIPRCEKTFTGSRRGWDAHVASRRRHSDWQSEIKDLEKRKRLFRKKFRDWFE